MIVLIAREKPASIAETGVMKDAIHLRRKKAGVLSLIAGGHRLEAAKRLGKPVTAVKSAVMRMRGRFRDHLRAAVALTVATLAMRGATGGNGNLLMVVGLQMLVGAAALAPFALLTESWSVDWSTRLVLAFGYTTLMPGLVATLIWFWLVRRIGATRAATFHFLNPVFGVAIAALLLAEGLSWVDALGVAIVAAGILAVQLVRLRPA